MTRSPTPYRISAARSREHATLSRLGAVDAAPQTKLEETTRYDPAEVEGRVFAGWIEGGYFTPEAEGTAEENFSVAIPPPNVTGSLHMGHALNGTIQDALVRRHRMAAGG